MIASKYLRSVCCGLLMLAVAGRACAVAIPWWGVSAGGAGMFVAGGVAGALIFKKFGKKEPVRVSYPDSKLYEVAKVSLHDTDQMEIRREQRKLSNLVNLIKDLEKNFVADVNERSLCTRMMQETLKDELYSGASDGDIENLKVLARKYIASDGDQKAALFIEIHREMKKQADKVKGMLENYKEKRAGA